jgi:hypothetical protein
MTSWSGASGSRPLLLGGRAIRLPNGLEPRVDARPQFAVDDGEVRAVVDQPVVLRPSHGRALPRLWVL